MPNHILNICVCVYILVMLCVLRREASIHNRQWLMQRNLAGKCAETEALLNVLYPVTEDSCRAGPAALEPQKNTQRLTLIVILLASGLGFLLANSDLIINPSLLI